MRSTNGSFPAARTIWIATVTEEGEMETGENRELLTTAELAEILRAPVSTVRYWRHIGEGPASFRLGRRVVYRRVDVDAWLEALRLAQCKAS